VATYVRNRDGSLQRIGYQQNATGGYTRTVGGSVSTSRGSIAQADIRARNQQAQQTYNEQTASRTETSEEAVASTVGPNGEAAVIKQRTTRFVGGFSSRSGDVYTQEYTGTSQSAVSSGNNQKPTTKTIQSPTPFVNRTEEFAGNRRQRFIGAFTSGFKEGSVVRQATGTPPEVSQRQYDAFSTGQRAAFQTGKAVRFFGEPTSVVLGVGPAIRGAGAATAAARASRFGGLPVARTVLGPTATGAVVRGTAFVAGTSVIGRGVERARINRIGRDAGISDLNIAVDTATSRYSEGSSRGRRFAENTFGSFVQQPRLRSNIESELISRGASREQAVFASQRVVSNRVVGRGYTDVLAGVGGEVVGETVGRLATGRATRYAANRFPQWGERTRAVVTRGAGSTSGGIFEGGLQAGAGSYQSSGRVRARDVAVGAGIGGAVAGVAGAGLGFFATSTSRSVRGFGRAYEGALDVIDPLERPGDRATDAFYAGYARRSGFDFNVPSGRASVRGAGTASSGFSGSYSRSSSRDLAVNSGLAVPSRSNVPFIVPSRAEARESPRSNLPSVSRSSGLSPSRSNSFSLVPTRADSFSQALVPTRAVIPTRTNVNARTNVPVRVATPPMALPFLPLFGGGAGRKGKGKGKGVSRVDRYASSLTAGVLNIRAKRGSTSSGGFSGIELRGLSF